MCISQPRPKEGWESHAEACTCQVVLRLKQGILEDFQKLATQLKMVRILLSIAPMQAEQKWLSSKGGKKQQKD